MRFFFTLFSVFLAVIYSASFRILSRPKRIVGGDLISRSQYDNYGYAVSLQLQDKDTFSHFCGGTYIGDGWIITAAHCVQVDTSNVYAQIGGYKLDSRANSKHRYKIVEIFSLPYNRHTSQNDIAVARIQLDATTMHEKYLEKSILLPTEYRGSEYLNDCFISGYGTTSFYGNISETLRYVNVHVISADECVEKMGRMMAPEPRFGMFCALAHNADACKGDSGGGLICKTTDDIYVLQGIISYGLGCEGQDIPGAYTNITVHMNWIKSIIYQYM